MRPAPRSSARGRSASRIHWDKVGRVTLVVVFVLVLASYINPVINFVDAWSDARTERANLAALQEETQRLEKRIQSLNQEDAAERAARKNGMWPEGEGAYVIEGLRK